MKRVLFSLILCTFQSLTAFIDIPLAGNAGLAYDHFRSIPDGDWDGNIGGVWNINVGSKHCLFDGYAFGVQAGGSYGVYDWSGRGSNVTGNPREVQQQGYVTGALTLETTDYRGFNVAIAYDWQINKNFGVFALPCGLSQVRFQGGYLWDCNEFGILGTIDTHKCIRHVEGIPVEFRAISQVSLYWQRYYENCARTLVFVGIPYKRSLLFSSGRAGKYLIGASLEAPLTNNFFIVAHGMYMQGHSAVTPLQSRTNAANICIGIDYRFGECGVPYLSIGNNSNFIVDTSVTY